VALKLEVNDEDFKCSYKIKMVQHQNNNEVALAEGYDISSFSRSIYSELPPMEVLDYDILWPIL
jgi:hypothetical protein